MDFPTLQRKFQQRRAAVEPHVLTPNVPTFSELRANQVMEVCRLRRISRNALRVILMKQSVKQVGAAPHCRFLLFTFNRLSLYVHSLAHVELASSTGTNSQWKILFSPIIIAKILRKRPWSGIQQ